MTWLKAWDEIIRRRQNENRILKYGLSFVLESPRMRVFKQPVFLGSSKEESLRIKAKLHSRLDDAITALGSLQLSRKGPDETKLDAEAQDDLDDALLDIQTALTYYKSKSEMRLDRPPLTHVACIDTKGCIWSLPRPCRHHNVLAVMSQFGAKMNEARTQAEGFLDLDGTYLTRDQALVNAEIHSQIKGGKIIGGMLTSEDLW